MTTQTHPHHPASQSTGPRRRRASIGWIVVGSLGGGLLAALLLVAAPFIAPEQSEVTGAVLCGFALGWAALAVLSVRFTDQPQRWAAAPALFMGLGVSSSSRSAPRRTTYFAGSGLPCCWCWRSG